MIGGFAAAAAAAQAPPPARLETVTVTGSRLPGAAGEAASADVVGPDTLLATNKPSVAALLADLPGVHINLPGSRGSVGELIVRGGEPNFTAVLVDGIRVNDPTNTRGGSFDFSTLNVDEIERIEIVRGPLSSVYGSDALSGLVNVITHEPDDTFTGHARVALGSEHFATAALRFGGPAAATGRYLLNASVLRDGDTGASAGYRNEAVSGKFDLFAGRSSSLDLHARHSRTELHAFPDASGGPLLATLHEQDARRSGDDSLGLTWQTALSERTGVTVRAAAFEHEEATASPGVAGGLDAIPPNTTDTQFSRDTLNAYVTTAFGPRLSAVLGTGYERESGTSDGTLSLGPDVVLPTRYALDRDTVTVFGELAYAASPALIVSAAIRRDQRDARASQTTGKLAFSHALGDGRARIRVAWAQGYKLPSLFSLGDPIVGNPDLLPETLTSSEIGLDLGDRTTRLGIELTAFAQRFENLIDFDFEQFRSVNRTRVATDGIEIGARYALTDTLTLRAHGTWTEIDVGGMGPQLRQRPERRAGANIRWSIRPDVGLFAGLRYVGPRLDASIPTGERTLPGYLRLDANVNWRIGPRVVMEIAVDNVTDRRYQDAIGFPSLGRRLRLALRTELGATR